MNDAQNAGPSAAASPLSSGISHAKGFVGSRWGQLDAMQRVRAVWAIVVVLSVICLLCWWALRPSWRVLYSGLTPDDARQIGAALTSANLTYDVTPDGTSLRVPAEQLDKARLTTAGKASGKAGRAGFELFDKPDWAGSDFDEKVNYQRALEGELEHTIDTLDDVQSSRVHLVLPHDSLFTDAQRDAKASVVLNLKSHGLSEGEAQSIKELVASAVDDLDSEHVVLMDGDGHALMGASNASNAKAVYEQSLAEHVLRTLEPVVGAGNVRATVNVDYDLSSRDEVDENYDPAQVVTLSMQKTEQASGAPVTAAGVPGTASNAPNQQAPLFPTTHGEGQSSKQENGTYGASKKTRHLIEGAGTVSRITAAILINDRVLPVVDKKKTPQQQPWTSDEMKQLVSLSQAAIGFQEARGDKVIVQNIRFDTPPVSTPGTIQKIMRQAGWAEPWIKDITLGIAGLVILLMILRPALKVVQNLAHQPHLLAGEKRGASSSPGKPATFGDHGQGAFEEVVGHIQRDPAQSARVLQTWIRAE